MPIHHATEMFNPNDFISLLIEFNKRRRKGTNWSTVAGYCAERCFKWWNKSATQTKKQFALEEKVQPKNRTNKCNKTGMVRDFRGARWSVDHKFLLYRIMNAYCTQDTTKETAKGYFSTWLAAKLKEGELLCCYSRVKLLAYVDILVECGKTRNKRMEFWWRN